MGIDSFTENSKALKKEKTKVRILVGLFGVLIWFGLTAFCVFSALYADRLVFYIGPTGTLFITFFVFPYLLLGGMYGYVASMMSFTIAFVGTLIFDMDNSYKMAIYLVPAICFSLFGQYFWFRNVKRTFIAGAFTLALTSVIEMACLSIIDVGRYEAKEVLTGALDLGMYFSRDIVVIFGTAFLLHLFFTKAPDICKLMFPIGIGYTRAYQENSELKRSHRKTRVSVKITAIIIGVELVLGICVGIFMIALFPDLKQMFIAGINGTDISGQSAIEGINFRFDARTFSYDIKMILMMLCVGVPMAAFANYYTKTSIGKPLGMMSDFMEEYASADDDKKLEVGHKVDRIKVKSHDEIQIVHESMKTTVHSIEEYIGRIRQEQELEKELEVAQKASEAKSSFLSNMSHEIRTPINAVLGMNEMILRESENEQIKEYAQNVKSAGNSLLGIVNDILDFSKIEAGKMDILPVEYHLSSMINDLINMISVKAKDKGLELIVNVDEMIPGKLIGDEVRVKQCVTNVLTNAVKYTEKGSVTMNVSYRQASDDSIYLKFQVIDTGIGIKEEDLSKLFSPFERIEEIRNRTIEGTGLGMSIVKKLLALMDTKLEVKSVYGEGSDFSFEVLQKVESWEKIGDFKEKYREYLRSLESYHEKFHAPDARILVVDDTEMNLTVVRGLLKSTRIQMDTALSGKETLVKITENKYDVIFIDHRMPEMDGLETLAAMKELEGNLNAGVPCIALTANAGAGAKDEYLKAGFDDYLSKPVSGERLEDMLKHYLPKEKILIEGDEGYDITEEGDVAASDAGVESDGMAAGSGPDDDFLDRLSGIDLTEAEKNCGGRDILRDVVKEFLISIDSKADNIESYAVTKDYRNYTVAVHALKSSSRLIGALELSKKAAYLEQCGNEENAKEITALTPELLELYRSYKEKLQAADEGGSDENLPEIPEEELAGALSDMKELLEAYDFDTADGIMNMLSEYRIPDSYREKYDRIKKLMANVDRDGLLEIL